MVQLSHSCMTTGKTTALTVRTFVSKVMSLLLNTLSRFVMAFPPRIWLPTPVSLPREFHGQKSLVGYNPWDCKELDMTEWLTLSLPSKEQASSNFLAVVTVCSDSGAQENKICHCFHFSPFYFPWNNGTRCLTLVFWMLSFKPAFSLSSFILIKRFFSPLHFLPLE